MYCRTVIGYPSFSELWLYVALDLLLSTSIDYCRSDFDYEILLIATCEFFPYLQLILHITMPLLLIKCMYCVFLHSFFVTHIQPSC